MQLGSGSQDYKHTSGLPCLHHIHLHMSIGFDDTGGDPNCNWAKFEKQKMVAFDVKLSLSTGDTSGINPSNHDGTTAHSSWNKLGKSVIKNGEMIGMSSDFWNNYEQDIQLAKDLGKIGANHV